MRTPRRWIAMMFVMAACGGESKPAADDRPPSVAPEIVTTLDAYAVVFDKLTSDLGAAAPDCAKAVAITERYTKQLDALEDQRTKLAELMAKVPPADEPAAGEWLAKRYAERFKTATLKLGPLVKSCEGDPALKAGMNALMSRFPMMR